MDEIEKVLAEIRQQGQAQQNEVPQGQVPVHGGGVSSAQGYLGFRVELPGVAAGDG